MGGYLVVIIVFLVGTSDYECIWGEYGCFLGFQVVMGVFGWSLGG